jgi:hypothetical protein
MSGRHEKWIVLACAYNHSAAHGRCQLVQFGTFCHFYRGGGGREGDATIAHKVNPVLYKYFDENL